MNRAHSLSIGQEQGAASVQRSVAAIRDGTVIDHIQPNKAIFLLRLLGLESLLGRGAVGLSLPSGKLGVKDIIKVEGWELGAEDASRIAIYAPSATVNIIQAFKVVRKYRVVQPQTVEGILMCPNSNCVTNHERRSGKFSVSSKKKQIFLRCLYCEVVFPVS